MEIDGVATERKFMLPASGPRVQRRSGRRKATMVTIDSDPDPTDD